ncbi:MAG: FkbM family methyltransferase [Phenylobacterium sp.]|uniref:FkbM family methyltransferase n=1 Tax=Phenylobacterium sp. TaxID=1871053 RepID=UPI001A5E1D9D|nr:FkbM family methyltransferase [Phenylobacterium sp.]MBL8553127.1 FkbM family methyltransferase [Phenylobacterium sp.]
MTAATKLLTTRDGRMLALAGDRFITPCLETYGELSPAERAILVQMIRPGMTVVEAGANVGAFTLAMARACHPGPLYAFEPQQRVFQILCANLAMNGIENVVASPDACGRAPGRATIPPLDYAAQNNFGGVSLSAADRPGQSVRITPLDELALPACGLVKADVEGFEVEVIEGARETIARCRPLLYVENDRREHRDTLIRLIHSLGYRLFWHRPALASPQNFNGVQRAIFDRNYVSTNMLCIPHERGTHTDLEPIDPANPQPPTPGRPAGG